MGLEEQQWDAVVVGAGLGGLCAALRLAHGGHRVLVLEQHSCPGGVATSFVRGRFEFEPSLHELTRVGSAEPSVLRSFLDEMGVELEFLPVPEAYRIVLTERGVDARLPFGREAFVDAIEAQVPGSRLAVTRYLDLCASVADALEYLQTTGGRPNPAALLARHGDFLRTAAYSVAEVGEAMGITDEVGELLYGYWVYLGAPLSRLSFTIWAVMLHVYLEYGGFVPRHRSHDLALAMARRVEAMGGTIEYNTAARAIHAEGGQVVAVETDRGERIPTHQVVANTSPNTVFGGLLQPASQVPEDALRLIHARHFGPSGFVVYLGLDASPEALGLVDYSAFILPDMDTERSVEAFAALDEIHLGMATVCLNIAVPDCSPPGTTILSFTTLCHGSAWEGLSPREAHEAKQRLASAIIGRFEGVMGVSLREHIEEIEVASPQTFARYTGAWDGGIYGYEPSTWDGLIPRAMALDEEQWVRGLHIAGGYGPRCHGFGGAMLSGDLAGKTVAAQLEDSP